MGAVIEGLTADGAKPGAMIRDQMNGPEQDTLFDDDAQVVREQFGGEVTGYKGPGRRKGSRNRVTAEMIEYVRKTCTDPILGLGMIASMTPAEIRKHYGLKRGKEVADVHLAALKELRSVLYPNNALADALKAAAKAAEGVQVGGLFAALMSVENGGLAAQLLGAAGPDVSGEGGGEKPRPQPIADQTQQNQGVSDG